MGHYDSSYEYDARERKAKSRKPYYVFEIFQGADEQWYWRLRQRNGKLVCVGGEGYTTKRNVKRACDALATRSDELGAAPIEQLHYVPRTAE